MLFPHLAELQTEGVRAVESVVRVEASALLAIGVTTR